MDNNMTPSDVAAVMGNNGWSGSDAFMWIFALLILANGGNWNGNNYRPQYATQDFVQNGFNFNDLQAQNRDILGAINQAKYDNIANSNGIQENLLREFGDIKTNQAAAIANENQCCSTTQSNIADLKYTMAQGFAEANANTTAQIQSVKDQLSQDKVESLQNQINALQLQNAMNGVVRYPQGWTYNAGMSPFCQCNCGNV